MVELDSASGELTGAERAVVDPAISATDVAKRYGRVEALRGVSLQVRRGSIHGLLGPNGAGKSTLIAALVGASRPTGGSVRILGHDPIRDAATVRALIGYMPQAPALYDDLSPRANMEFFARAHRMPDLHAAVDRTLDFVALTDRQHDPVYTFSGGMKQRVSLGCALVHSPEVLFLDEPTAGVDPRLRASLWERFRLLAAGGTTLFISTHLMDEAMLCDRLTVVRDGAVLVEAAPRALLDRGATEVVVWRAERADRTVLHDAPASLPGLLHAYGLDRAVTRIELHGETLEEVILSLIEEAGEP